jgi:hypothetical protein
VTIFGAVQYGVIDTKQEVTVNDVTYRPTDELFADGDGNTEFSVIELKDLYDRGEISKIQYEDALNRPHQAAPKSLGITAGPTIRPSDEYRLLEPTPASPQKTAAELRATGYSEDQIEAMTKVNAAGYSATETIGDEIIVVAGQSNPDITANPDAYKQVREPYGIGTVYTAKSASEAAKLAGQPGLSDAENWIITSTGNIIYSDTPVKEEDLPSGVTPGMCLQVQPDSPYDTTEFDPASKSYTEDEVKSSADSSRFGLTGNKIITNKVIGHSEQTVSSIPPGANPDDYIEVSPVYPYGNVDINASPLTVAQLAAAAPGSFGPTGAKLSTVTVQGSARPTADEHGTPYADSDCTVASWGAVDSSVAPETIDWPHTGTTGDGFKYVYNGSYPTDPPTILFENPATDSEYRTNAHYDVQEKTLPRLSIAVPQQPNSKDNIINLAFNLPEIEAAGGRVQISINNQIIHINHSPYNIKQILADNLYNANETIDITVYIVDAAGNELANSKQCTLAITSTEKNIKKGSKYNIETGPFSSAPQLWEIYEKKGTRQPLVPASWTVPVFEYKPRVQNPPTYKPPIYEEVAEYKLYVLNPTLYKAPTGETEYLYQLKAQNWIEKAPTEATYYEPQYEHFAPQQETFSVRKFERSGEETTILTGKNRDTEFTAATGMQFGVSRRVINGKVVEMTLNADGTVAYKLTNFQRENNFSMQNGESMITNSDGTYTERTVSGVPEEFTRNGGQIVYDMKAGCGIKFKEGPLEGVSLWANGIIRKDAVSAEKQVNYNMDSLEDWVSKYGGELGLSWGAGSLWNGTAVFRYLHGINGTDEFWAGLEQRFGEHFRAGVETDFQNYITARTALTFGNGWTFTGSASTDSIFENRTVADILGLQPSLSDTNDPFFKVGAGIAYSREFDNPVLTGLTLTGDISLNIPRQEFEHNYGLSLGFIPTTFGRSMFELNGSATFNNTELQDVGGKVFWNLHKNHQLSAGFTHNPGSGQNKAEVGYKLNIESKKP